MESDQPDLTTPEAIFGIGERDRQQAFEAGSAAHEVHIPLHANAEAEYRFDHSESSNNESPEEPPQFPEHHDKSIWHNIPLDETGRATQNSSYGEAFQQEKQPEAPVQDDEEIKAASGQLAVGTSADVQASHQDETIPVENRSLRHIVEQVSSIIHDAQQLLNSSSSRAVDAILWGILAVIIIAIIAALRS